MSQRLDYIEQSPEFFKKFVQFSTALHSGTIDDKINGLLQIRASQMNGCAFCLDMHIKQAKIHGETELRLHHIPIWRESPMFSAREPAALAWTEVLTSLPATAVSADFSSHVRAPFSEKKTP